METFNIEEEATQSVAQNGTHIPQRSHIGAPTEQSTQSTKTFNREEDPTQSNTHNSETSVKPDKTTESKNRFWPTSNRQGSTTADGGKNFQTEDRIETQQDEDLTSHSTPQNYHYGSNQTGTWMHTSNLHTNTPNTGNIPFMDPIMDNNYTDSVMRGYSNQYGHSGNATISTISNANSILYGMENYGNDGWQPNFPSTEDDNIGNKIKIKISIDSKLPVEILNEKEEQQHQSMYSNSLWKSSENENDVYKFTT